MSDDKISPGWRHAVTKPGWKPQRQDGLIDQLRDLIPIAQKEGCYDAADYLKGLIESPTWRGGWLFSLQEIEEIRAAEAKGKRGPVTIGEVPPQSGVEGS